MSTFGSPGGRSTFSKPTPPERGSFPLDHDGECKTFMVKYLKCIRQSRGVNEEDCRMMSKAYLQCRMDHNLMAEDTMENLGYGTHNKDTDIEKSRQNTKEVAQEPR